jgi:mRNA interferase RelE/StbE
MKVLFRKSFSRDLKGIKDWPVLDRITKAVAEVEAAPGPQVIPGLTKLSGTQNCYRIRVGDYRLGIVMEQDVVTFARCLHRRDLYRFFP